MLSCVRRRLVLLALAVLIPWEAAAGPAFARPSPVPSLPDSCVTSVDATTALESGGSDSTSPVAPAAGDAQQEPPGSSSFFDNFELFGLADIYYDWFSTKPTGDAALRVFDQKHNQIAMAMVGIGVAKLPTAESRAGGRIDLNFGPAMAVFHATEPGGVETFQHVQEGYLSYLAPIGSGLQIDAGKFVTPIGAEPTEAKDNWNYSRSILFFAGPYYHSGVRFAYAFNDRLSLGGGVSNGWNDVVDNNAGKTVNLQVSVKPTPQWTIVQNYMAGPERPDDDDGWRHLSDTTVSFTATDKLSLMVNYDYGRDSVASEPINWQGVALYAKYSIDDVFAIAPRFEYIDDHDGFVTGESQSITAFTLTCDMKLTPSLLWRAEYRGDDTGTDYFMKRSGAATSRQHSIGFALLYSFSSKTP